jgi:hypothetical protein
MAETPHVQNSHGTSCTKDDQELFQLRHSLINESIDSIKAKTSAEENNNVFSELTNFKKSLRATAASFMSGVNLSNCETRQDNIGNSRTTGKSARTPLARLDINIDINKNSTKRSCTNLKATSHSSETAERKSTNKKPRRDIGTLNQIQNHARTMEKRASKQK